MSHTLRTASRLITLLSLVAVPLLVALFPLPANGATLRGKLERVDQKGRHIPASGIKVTVYGQDTGRSSVSVTDANGMYSLNVRPGNYSLEAWVSSPPKTYPITVVEPNTDIPAIVISDDTTPSTKGSTRDAPRLNSRVRP
jgi:carboxypeptidase family protein